MSEHYWNYCAMDRHFEHGGLSATYGDLIEALHDAYERNDDLEADVQYGRETNEYCQQAAEISNKALAAKDAEITELKASNEALMQRTRKLENQPANPSWEELAAKDRTITDLNEDQTDLREQLATANANCRAATTELAHLLAMKDTEIAEIQAHKEHFAEVTRQQSAQIHDLESQLAWLENLRRCKNCNAWHRGMSGPKSDVAGKSGTCRKDPVYQIKDQDDWCRDGFEPREDI